MIGQSEAPWVLPSSLHQSRSALCNTSGACSRGWGLHLVNAQGRDTKVALGNLATFSPQQAITFAPSHGPCQKQPKALPKQCGGKCAAAAPNPIHEAAVLASRGWPAARRLEFCCRVSLPHHERTQVSMLSTTRAEPSILHLCCLVGDHKPFVSKGHDARQSLKKASKRWAWEGRAGGWCMMIGRD